MVLVLKNGFFSCFFDFFRVFFVFSWVLGSGPGVGSEGPGEVLGAGNRGPGEVLGSDLASWGLFWVV